VIDQLTQQPVREIVVFDNFVRGTRANLASALKSPKVSVVDGSITDVAAVKRVVEGADGVFMLASLWLGECVSDPRAAWETNTLGTWNVVEACRQAGVKRVVFSSSASVYGNAVSIPMTEDHPFANRTTYGATKIANEQMFRAIYEQHKLPYVGLRYMNVYGPRMDYRGVYVTVIMRVIDRILEGKAPVIHGDGSQMYDFIYVDDVARANVLAMKADCADEFFNVGRGVGTTINELVSLILEITGSKLKPEYLPETASFVTSRIGCTKKAKALLGFEGTTELRDGLERVVAWRKTVAGQS
jgi:UDP-glucose 4-epimerase